ncbi:MAG TPA: hypothetical protein VLM91_26735 [Candidatus Methylomirabilis sp.]|nr:hypothetical protein [Candidatus Methylomirabilis sp.]
MALQPPGTFKYDLQSITQHASPASGVYALFSPSECVYVGESDDVCASLLETFFEDNPSLNDQYITHFTIELVSPESRVARQAIRIRELRPVGNGRLGSPECGHIRGPQGQSGREAVRLAEHHGRETASPGSPSLRIGSPGAPEVTPAAQGSLRPPDPPGQARTVEGPQARKEEKASDHSTGQLPTGSRPEIPLASVAKVLPPQKKPITCGTEVRSVPKNPQSKATLCEVAEEQRRSAQGQIDQLRPTPQAVSGLTERILAKIAAEEADRKLAAQPQLHPALPVDVKQIDRAMATTVGGRAHWRLAAISGLLLGIAVASFWASFP